MCEFVKSELIRGSESPDQAELKFLRGCYSRLIHTTEEQSEKCVSMAAILLEVKKTLSQISNQLGIHTIEAESSHQTPPVTFSASYVRDDQNRLPTTDEHTEKFDSMEALLREMKQAPSIEMPEFDASNVSDWLSKVERSFPARRYSDLDRLDLVAFSLEGDVLRWFNWEMTRREFRSWDEFRRRLLLRFGTAPAESPGNRRFAIKPTETVYAQVTAQQPVHKEESVTNLQVPVSKLEHGLQIHNESPHLCENYQDVVGCDELGKEEKMFSGLSQTSQVWEPGGVLASVNVADSLGEKASYTEKKLILQYQEMDSTNGTGADVESANGANGANGGGDIDALPPPPPILAPNVELLHVKTEPVEKKNLRVPMARKGFGTKDQKIPLLTNHFKVDVAGLQGHFYHYSVALANAMRGQESENCEEVGGNILGCREWGQLVLADLRSHTRHKWKSKHLRAFFNLQYSPSYALDVVNKTSKPWEKQMTFTSAHVASVNSLSFAVGTAANWSIGLSQNRQVWEPGGVLADHVLEDNVEAGSKGLAYAGCVLLGMNCAGLGSGKEELLVTGQQMQRTDLFSELTCSHNKKQMLGYKTRMFKYKSSLRITRSVSRDMNQFVGFMKFQLKHKWRSKHLHPISALGFYLSSVFSTVPSATSGRLQGLLEQVLQKDDEAYPQILDKLQLNLKQGMDVHGASGLRLFLCQQKFSSIWHRWRRKDSDLEVQLKERALVQSSVSPELLDGAVWIPEVGCRELLVKWQDHDASENFWMFSKDFVQLYPSSKLEDKLVFEGGSIDTIKQSYYRKKKPWVETEGFSCKEALEGNGGFAVSLEV